MKTTKVSELTIDELMALMRQEMANMVRAAVQEAIAAQKQPDQMAIFDIPPLKVDPRHPALHLGSRADIYADDDE